MRLISIIMPIYNSQKYLADSIGSILRQTYKEFELILMDDGSMDQSLSIIHFFCEKDSRVKGYHIENRGVSGARNVGLSYASGEYVYFADADDQMPEDGLEKLIKAMEAAREVDFVIGDFHSEADIFHSQLQGIHTMEEFVLDFSSNLPAFYYGVIWNKLYKAEIIRENGIRFDEKMSWCEDFLFNIEYEMLCRKVFYVKDEIYIYVNRENSLVKDVDEMGEEDVLKIELKRSFQAWKLAKKAGVYQAEERIQDYILSVINSAFSNIAGRKNAYDKTAFKDFESIILTQNLKEITGKMTQAHNYIIFVFMKWCINHNRYRLLFRYYCLKDALRKNRIFCFILNRISISPEFRL